MSVLGITDVGTSLYTAALGANGLVPTTGFAELIEITGTPDMGAAPATLEATTLKMSKKSYLADRQDNPSLTYSYNYTKENREALNAIAGEKRAFLQVYQDGSGEVIVGELATYTSAISLGSVATAQLIIIPESITWVEDTTAYIQ